MHKRCVPVTGMALACAAAAPGVIAKAIRREILLGAPNACTFVPRQSGLLSGAVHMRGLQEILAATAYLNIIALQYRLSPVLYGNRFRGRR